jgi:hypothetical protein
MTSHSKSPIIEKYNFCTIKYYYYTNVLYYIFDNIEDKFRIDFNSSIGEIIEFKKDKWILEGISDIDSRMYDFEKCIKKILNDNRFRERGDYTFTKNKIVQMIYLLKLN